MSKDYFSDERIAESIAHREKLNQQVSVKEGHIVVSIAYEYNIPLNACDTPEKILGWVQQLCSKSWITAEVIDRFVQVATDEHGIKVLR